MTYTIELRRDTAANWTSINPILHDGEMGVEKDTGKLKLGNGSTPWTGLPYLVTEGDTGPQGPPGADGAPGATGDPGPSGDGTVGRYRGPWAADELVWADDFHDDTIVDSGGPWSIHYVSSGDQPVVLNMGALPTPVIAGAPAYAKTAAVLGLHTFAAGTDMTLALAALGIANITRIKFWRAFRAQNNGGNVRMDIQKNGVSQAGLPESGTQSTSWSEIEYTAASSDTFVFSSVGTAGVHTGADAAMYIAGVRVYAVSEPYMAFDTVVKDGITYQSIVDNNSSTPGVDASWVVVLPASATASLGIDTALDIPPVTPSAFDYEFPAVGSAAPSKAGVVQVGAFANASYVEQNGRGTWKTSSNTNVELTGHAWNMPAGATWDVMAKFRFAGTRYVNYVGGGLCILDTVNNKILSFRRLTTVGLIWDTFTGNPLTTSTGFGVGPQGGLQQLLTPDYWYMRIRKNSTTSYDLMYSTDGENWNMYTAGLDLSAWTLSKMGWFNYTEAGANSLHCEWIRQVA